MKYLIIVIAALFIGYVADASEFHHHNHDYSVVSENTTVNQSSGAALGIATSQHHFDWATKKWQGSVGVGSYDGDDAYSFGMGKRLDRMLINGSVSREGDKYGFGGGINWRF